jgi:hypothetical protein
LQFLLHISKKSSTFAPNFASYAPCACVCNEREDKKEEMSNRRWNRLMNLDKAYRLAQTIAHSMQQIETASVMSKDEAIATLRAI